jgi:hypothetical protein
MDISLARALLSFAKTFALNTTNLEHVNLINNTLDILHDGDRAALFRAAEARHGSTPGTPGTKVPQPDGSHTIIPYANAPFVKDVFVLWNQFNLLNNVYISLIGSGVRSYDTLVSDIHKEVEQAEIPAIYGSERETIVNNVFQRYVAMLKTITGRIFSVVDKNLIETNVNKSSTLARYKLGVADLFGGSDFAYRKENSALYTKFILLAEWYFTTFRSKDMFDIKPFILKESGDFRGLNEAVLAKIYDNVAYTQVSLGKIASSVNTNPDIKAYIEAINRAIGFYIFNTVDVRGKHNRDLINTLGEPSTTSNIFSGIPTKLPLSSAIEIGLPGQIINGPTASGLHTSNSVKSRFDIWFYRRHVSPKFDNSSLSLA